ncbi:MAG: HEAT repeat domain-containing protein [Kofleriaceae bacterium]|nr:HEAT repeat domain-containing protein [Kofleriaceae bacterium]MCL4227269.1 HEAT repeat domain-containing protein [Myxococcales bacterium]
MARAVSRRALGAALVSAALALGVVAGAARPAAADEARRIAELSATMDERNSERERIAAVTALARLGSKPTLKPLVAALADRSPQVRAIAATGLGKLGHRAALPALRNAAASDADPLVRKRAAEAVAQVSEVNGITPATTLAAAPAGKAGFGTNPRAVAPRPEIYMVVKSASDDSPGVHDKRARQSHADLLRATLSTEVAQSAAMTNVAADAQKFGLDLRNVDVSCVSLETRHSGGYVEIEAQLRLAISDDRGKMLSFLSGGAKVQVPRRTFDPRYLPQLRKEALENAVRGLFGKLVDHLRRSRAS